MVKTLVNFLGALCKSLAPLKNLYASVTPQYYQWATFAPLRDFFPNLEVEKCLMHRDLGRNRFKTLCKSIAPLKNLCASRTPQDDQLSLIAHLREFLPFLEVEK